VDWSEFRGGHNATLEMRNAHHFDRDALRLCMRRPFARSAKRRLTSVGLDAPGCPQLGSGYACVDFGIVRIPRKIGFRFRFSAQKSGIASGASIPQNFEWTAQ
jgi:hypothetical protein